MRLSLRWHIFFTVAPLLLILAVLGGAGAILLYHVGGRIDLILHENYRSVIYMQHLHDALERIDDSFQFALGGEEKQAREQYATNWQKFEDNLRLEQDNITLPNEEELVAQLTHLTARYRRQGDVFYTHASGSKERHRDYFGSDGRSGVLLQLFKDIKTVSGEILRINQANMEQASRAARDAAGTSLTWFATALAVTVILAGLLAWRTTRTILQPIRAVTQSAQEISAGNLDQVVPVLSADELGQLAQTFNLMARHLRDYRQSQSAQLLRAQRTSQATIDSFPDPVLVIDSDGHVEMANPSARRLLGVAPVSESNRQKAVGTRQRADGGLEVEPPSAACLLPSGLRAPLAEALRGQRDYLPEGFDKAVVLGSAGRERAVLPRILTIRDPYGSTLGAAVLLQDVTRLRLLDQVKSNLVATASHELKTPLTSIRLAVHLLLEEAAGPLAAKQTELLLDARENCERLLAMINNLLDLARLEQGWRQLNTLSESPETLLRTAADAIRPRAEDKGVEIVLELSPELPAVAVDASRIGTALRNLLDNALTYTEAGGRIVLSAAAGPNSVMLAVADNGHGIPPDHLPHVFEKFFRVPGQSRGSGTGLGLAIVHEIVTAHGGSITCESRPGSGTVFRLTLPIATTPESTEPSTEKSDVSVARSENRVV